MKNMKSILFICLCAAAVSVASVFGTLAYLTDHDSATNTFTVGRVDIGLDEERVTPDGKPTPEEDDRVRENLYHLIPGQIYVKDPTVTVASESEEAYIRMLVTISCYDALQEIYGGSFLPQNFVSGWDGSIWVSTGKVEVSADGSLATYEFRYHTAVDGFDAAGNPAAEKLPPLFESFTVPGNWDGDDLSALADLKIDVVGHAIQKAGFADEVQEGTVIRSAEDLAWEAFDRQHEA